MPYIAIQKTLASRTFLKQLSCGGLVLAADILFYVHPAGWTSGLFVALLVAAITLHRQLRTSRLSDIAGLAALGLVFALIESPTFLSVTLALGTVIAYGLLSRLWWVDNALTLLWLMLSHLFTGWARLLRDSVVIAAVRRRCAPKGSRPLTILRNWLLPVSLSGLFIALFAAANPIIMEWLGVIRWDIILPYLEPERILFWGFTAGFCWPLIRPARTSPPANPVRLPARPFTLTGLLFNERSVLTSLMLFNALFAVQNLLDVAFLWTGFALPQGVSYAEYAHQGAYPLMATALLAAVFVLIAFRPGSKSTQGLRALVYAWVGQNVFLVVSSISRLAGYVEQYSLTWLRVEAFIWMGLVAAGLMLIVTRIHFAKSNRWLINSNAAMLYATLYACCFINFGGIIAEYNLSHCNRMFDRGGSYSACDIEYLKREVGVEALPALIRYEQGMANASNMGQAMQVRRELVGMLTLSLADWHQWTFRNWRIAQSLPLSLRPQMGRW